MILTPLYLSGSFVGGDGTRHPTHVYLDDLDNPDLWMSDPDADVEVDLPEPCDAVPCDVCGADGCTWTIEHTDHRVSLCLRCAARLRRLPTDDVPIPWFVNAYLVDRAYGGPEEGGWWYDCGTLEDCNEVSTFRDAADLVERWERVEYSNDGRPDISSVLSEGQYWVRLTFCRPGAAHYPEYRPHYE